MATLSVHTAETDVTIGTGEALGFFGSDSFGDPIAIGEYNGRTFITTPSGTTQYEECDNCKYLNTSGVIVGQTGNGINLQRLPNYLATMNIRFTHPVDAIIQNAFLTIYEDEDLLDAPDGLTVYAAEIIHTSKLQTATGTGDTNWVQMLGSSQKLSLVASPGTSGLSPSGPATQDTRHDWYVAVTVTPTTPGDKTFGFKVDLEYI
jgi:hypothetical protein